MIKHEVAYERTISKVCFVRNDLYASTAEKGPHRRDPKKDKHIIQSTKCLPSLQEHVNSRDPLTRAS